MYTGGIIIIIVLHHTLTMISDPIFSEKVVNTPPAVLITALNKDLIAMRNNLPSWVLFTLELLHILNKKYNSSTAESNNGHHTTFIYH